MNTADLNRRKQASTPRGISVAADFFAAKAENSELWDTDGNRYIDFASGIAVLNTGHRHPKIIDAVKKQLDAYTHTAYYVVPYAPYVELAEQINAATPGDYDKKTVFLTTGAEAVENAIKIARVATGRAGVISFSGAFHGRTLMGMALTGKVVPYKEGFGPFPDSIYHVPFPNQSAGVTTEQSLAALKQLFAVTVSPKSVAAIIFEPIQGEGGFNVAPVEFVQSLKKICDEHGILLIADEIQTGFARTGKMFAIEHYGIEPDMITMAKSLAGGFPLSAVCGRAEIMDAPNVGSLGGTYAGHPLALVAAQAVFEIIEEEKLCERAVDLGKTLTNHLQKLQNQTTGISNIRGLGSMVAVEFTKPDGGPDTQRVVDIITNARKKGLILLSCGAYGNAIRFLFPLTISNQILNEGLEILTKVVVN